MADVETPTAPTTEGPKDIKDAKESAKEAVEAFNLLAQGKRNMLCNEIPQAVNQLQEACRLLASKYGEVADQCGEAYLCYGTALLDLSRMESGVLGNALQGIDSEDDESASSDDKIEDPDKVSEKEREEISDKVIDALTEERGAAAEKKDKDEANKEAKDKDETKEGEKKDETKEEAKEKDETKEETKEKDETKKEAKENGEAAPMENGHAENGVNGHANGVEKTDQTKDDAMDTEETKEKKDDEDKETEDDAEDEGNESESIEDEEGEKTGEEGEKTGEEGEKTGEDTEGEAAAEGEAGSSKKKEEEDVSNLQLAWEMLELAKVIYSRHDSKEMKLKTADAYLKLGEVGLETEQYEQAIGDFKACLKLQKDLLEPESRLIAETHYQIGLACCFNQTYEESIEHLNTAVSVINSKVSKLEKVIEEAEKENKGKEVNAFDDPVPHAQKEIKDLKEILPDILAKIEDTKDEMQSQDKLKKLVKENVAPEFGTSTGFSSSTTDESIATVDSSLVRKKRKPEEEAEDKKPEEKKARQEEGAGDSAAKETTEKMEEEKA